MARAAPASSSEQTAPRASDAHDDAPAPPADDAPAPRRASPAPSTRAASSASASSRVSVRRYDDFAGSYEDRCFLVVNPITGAVAVGLHLAILVAVATGRDADWLQHWRRLARRAPAARRLLEPRREPRPPGATFAIRPGFAVAVDGGRLVVGRVGGGRGAVKLSDVFFEEEAPGEPVDDVEAELQAAGLDPADYVGDLLPEAAKLLRTVQRDLNVSAKVAVPLASLLMLRVALDVCVLPERYAHLDASHVAFMSLVYAHRRHHDAALHVAAEAFAARKPRHSRARTRAAGSAALELAVAAIELV
ncbi:hypothetical protein SO694_00190012 [Aureococcus anophagefferens]|uniref:Uncharacterized protein n=1 Tax=Aureococcus anophagefferens TaxID=44056 RepID=A0ABR1FP75_AURAN